MRVRSVIEKFRVPAAAAADADSGTVQLNWLVTTSTSTPLSHQMMYLLSPYQQRQQEQEQQEGRRDRQRQEQQRREQQPTPATISPPQKPKPPTSRDQKNPSHRKTETTCAGNQKIAEDRKSKAHVKATGKSPRTERVPLGFASSSTRNTTRT